MSGALQAVFQNQRSFGPPPGQQTYNTPGTYTWVCPAGVTSVSILCVGGGGGGFTSGGGAGGGGGLAYRNNFTVTPGASYDVVVTGYSQSGDTTFNAVSSTCGASRGSNGAGGAGGSGGAGGGFLYGTAGYSGGAGGNGGPSFVCCGNTYFANGAGGGAAGYAGNGGAGATVTVAPFQNLTGGNGSGGGGGGGGTQSSGNSWFGGGVGSFGQGASGAGGSGQGGNGGRGSDVSDGNSVTYEWGGGSRGGATTNYPGIVRILWPGNTRSYPSTNTGNL